ncbi:tetratricopeptide repeat protein [Leptobacterium sp. I13]|uniref:tetratricopeptide repeat protein n=1 Tax=Leptobacterium meishanense TaxID=3128904 RepID=UPI0030ED1BE7
MKRQILIFSAILVSTISFAQKKELKTAEKSLSKGDVAGAKVALESAKALIASADDKTKAQYYLIEGKINHDAAKKGDSYELAIASFKKVISIEESGKKTYTDEANQLLETIFGDMVNDAVKANEQKDYAKSSKLLYMAYQLNKTQTDYLYFAASTAVSIPDYDKALEYYIELKDIGYTGISKKYYVTDASTNEEQEVSKTEYDIFKKSKDYKNFREVDTESKFPEIIKNIALIYTQKGENEKAIEAIKEARKASPEDISLLLTEANLYIKLGQKDKFKAAMEEAIERDPNNAILYFNLGVITAEQGDNEAAKKYYEKSIEVDPNYKDSYLNISSLILSEEVAIVDEMNGLGTSRADNARYDELKEKRENLYRSAIPYLQKILDIEPNDVDAVRTLMNIYGTLGENDKYKEMKTKLASLEQ